MTVYKHAFATFPPSSEEALKAAFAQYQFKAIMQDKSSSRGQGLATAKGLDVNGVHIFADREIAIAQIKARTKRGGPAIAVRLVERDPVTRAILMPGTNEPRTVWLVGADCAVHEEVI